MNREAVALGTPVYTTFTGQMGAVDGQLVAEGRLQTLEDPAGIAVERKQPAAERVTRDPALLLDLLLTAL
jgi:predicted glycosyltransferase